MKNIILSTTVAVALSSFAVAGGNIAPAKPIVEPVAGNFYVGISYSCLDARQTDKNSAYLPNIVSPTINEDFESIMLQAGYKFNPYIAIEGRYWYGLEETIVNEGALDFDSSINIWGIYAKPMYPATESLDVYGLLGYASTDYDTSASIDGIDGFSWGLGVAYSFTENISVFADYVSIFDEESDYSTTDDSSNTYNFGVTYQF